MRGMITGLALDSTLGDLALKFNVTLEVSLFRSPFRSISNRKLTSLSRSFSQSIALQTRHILEEMNSKGHQIDSIYMSGSSLSRSPLRHVLLSLTPRPLSPFSFCFSQVVKSRMSDSCPSSPLSAESPSSSLLPPPPPSSQDQPCSVGTPTRFSARETRRRSRRWRRSFRRVSSTRRACGKLW